MDSLLRSGFSEDQLKGVDVDNIYRAFGQEPKKASMPDPKIDGKKTPDGSFQGISAAENSRALSPDVDTGEHFRENLKSTLTQSNVHQDPQHDTATLASSFSAPGDGVMPIAIVGMSCRFPGSCSNVEDFSKLVSEGRSAWSEIPESRFNVDAFYHPNSDRTDTVSPASAVFAGSWLIKNLDECQSRPLLTRSRVHPV